LLRIAEAEENLKAGKFKKVSIDKFIEIGSHDVCC
jgi:hypothetical protein